MTAIRIAMVTVVVEVAMKEGFVHTFLVVIACIAIYNFALKPFLPAVITNVVGM